MILFGVYWSFIGSRSLLGIDDTQQFSVDFKTDTYLKECPFMETQTPSKGYHLSCHAKETLQQPVVIIRVGI